ncbi:hypothetical protein [Nocardia sp. NPDC048505]|uniref:hypothetical protein n=1 Tax=unclassified Nocardia TaxID=2637762 RepID=UPI0033F13F42
MAMEWLAIVGTLSGAVVGAGATLLADVIRARRDKALRSNDIQRQIYVKFLATVVQTDNAMQALALGGPTPLGREESIAAFRSHHLVAALLELELVAPPPVRDAAKQTYERLRDIREALASTALTVGGPDNGSAEWHAVHRPFRGALEQLKEAMRQELGPAAITARASNAPALPDGRTPGAPENRPEQA